MVICIIKVVGRKMINSLQNKNRIFIYLSMCETERTGSGDNYSQFTRTTEEKK